MLDVLMCGEVLFEFFYGWCVAWVCRAELSAEGAGQDAFLEGVDLAEDGFGFFLGGRFFGQEVVEETDDFALLVARWYGYCQLTQSLNWYR